MFYHHQNLNERATTKEPYTNRYGETLLRYQTTYGSIVRAGRAWVHFDNRAVLGWEWHFFPRYKSLGASLWHDGAEGEWGAGLRLFFCTLYARLESWPWFHVKDHRYGEKELSWSIHDGALWWNLWKNTHEHRAKDPKWRRGTFFPLDFLFGRQKYVNVVLSRHTREIAFPEGTYPVVVALEHCTWRRPRWPLVRQQRTATVNVLPESGIPIPGKGENSWDIDDDAVFSLSCPAQTVEEALAHLQQHVERTRERHGGLNWQPSKSA